MADLAQALISDVRKEVYSGRTKQAVLAYWHVLQDNGVTDYAFEQCWDDFCRSGPERWIFLFTVLADMGLPSSAVQYFHDQLLDFIEEHQPQDCYILKPLVVIP